MKNFLKSTLVGLGLAAAMLMPSEMVSASDKQVRLHMQHVNGPGRAPTDGVYHRILDTCNDTRWGCRREVQVKAQVEYISGGATTVPHHIDVDIEVTRIGPFFPDGHFYPIQTIRILANEYYQTLTIRLALDHIPEIVETNDGLGIVSVRIVELRNARGVVANPTATGFSIVDRAGANLEPVRIDLDLVRHFTQPILKNNALHQVLDACQGTSTITCTRYMKVKVEAKGILPYAVKVGVHVKQKHDNGSSYLRKDHEVYKEFHEVNLGPGHLNKRDYFYIPLLLDRTPERDNEIIATLVDIKLLNERLYEGNYNHTVHGLSGRAVTIANPNGVSHPNISGVKLEATGFSVLDDDPEFEVVAAESAVQEGEYVEFELVGNKQAPNHFDIELRYDNDTNDPFGFINHPRRYDRFPDIRSGSGELRSDGRFSYGMIRIATHADENYEPENGAITARLGRIRLEEGYSRDHTAVENASRATVRVLNDDGPPEFANNRVPRYTIDPLNRVRIEGDKAVWRIITRGATNPNMAVRLKVDFTYEGDLFGDTPVTTKYIDIGAASRVAQYDYWESGSAFNYYEPANLYVDTVDDDIDEVNGQVTATITNAWVGHSTAGYSIPITSNGDNIHVVDDETPEFSIVLDPTHTQSNSVTEGDRVLFALRSSSAPRYDEMNLQITFAFVGDFFGDASLTQIVRVGPTIGGTKMFTDGAFYSVPFELQTVDDTVDEYDGSIAATITGKSHVLTIFEVYAGIELGVSVPRSIPLRGSENATFNVTVLDNEATTLSVVADGNHYVPEGTPIVMKLERSMALAAEFRYVVSIAYNGDFFGASPVATVNVDVGPNIGTTDSQTGRYTSPSFTVNTVGDDVDDPGYGRLTATVTAKKEGHSDSGAEQTLESITALNFYVLDTHIPETLTLHARNSSVSSGAAASFYLTDSATTSNPNPLSVTVAIEYTHLHRNDGYGTLLSDESSTVAVSSSNSFALSGGGYEYRQQLTTQPLLISEVSGDVRVRLTSVTETIMLPIGEATYTRNIASADQVTAFTEVVNIENAPVFFFTTGVPTTEGQPASIRLFSGSTPTYNMRIRVNFSYVGDFFFDNPITHANIDVGPNVGMNLIGFYYSPIYQVPTLDDDVTEPDGSVTATIAWKRYGHSDTGAIIPLHDLEAESTMTVTVEDSEPSSSPAAGYMQMVENLASQRSPAAMLAYREESSMHESSMINQGARNTQIQSTLAFDRGNTVNIQTFVTTIGNAINQDTDLSKLTNMPAFTLPLTPGTELSGPITMWGASNSSNRLAVGQVGMDMSIHDRYVFGMNVTKLESELSEAISEDMSMVQSYAAYRLGDLRLSAIVGLGSGDLAMDGFGTFDTSRTLAQIGVHSELLDYEAELISGALSLDSTAGISKHTVAETAEYYGWTTIGRDHALSVTNTNTIATALGEFSPAVWTGFDDDLTIGGGAGYDYGGLSASVWLNGRSIAASDDLAVDVSYGYAAADTTITPSVSFVADGAIKHRYGLNIASGKFNLGGAVTESNRVDINGFVRW